jgi:hypothetical protein
VLNLAQNCFSRTSSIVSIVLLPLCRSSSILEAPVSRVGALTPAGLLFPIPPISHPYSRTPPERLRIRPPQICGPGVFAIGFIIGMTSALRPATRPEQRVVPSPGPFASDGSGRSPLRRGFCSTPNFFTTRAPCRSVIGRARPAFAGGAEDSEGQPGRGPGIDAGTRPPKRGFGFNAARAWRW